MKFEPFALERWLLKPCGIDVAGGGVTKLKLRDITATIDYERLMKYGVTTNGSEELRKQIADWFPGVEPDNILVTSATSEANLLCNLHLLDSGDEYVAESPYYAQTVGFAKAMGCKIKDFHLEEQNGWKPNLQELNEVVTRKTKIIFFDNPNNPTGALLTDQEMRAICEIAKDAGAYVVCDNALRGSELDGQPGLTPFGYYEKAVITGSISKLGMTDPRIGWIIADKEFVKACWRIKDYTSLSHSGLGEYLAIQALRRETRERINKRNLEFSKSNLPVLSRWIEQEKAVLSCVQPKAGFTAFPKYNLPLSSEELCNRFLTEEKVLLAPGEQFGVDKHFRINIGCPQETMSTVLKRMSAFLKRIK